MTEVNDCSSKLGNLMVGWKLTNEIIHRHTFRKFNSILQKPQWDRDFMFSIQKKYDNENCTILIPKRNSYCRRKSSTRGPRFKVSSDGLSTEMDTLIWSPIQVQTEADAA